MNKHVENVLVFLFAWLAIINLALLFPIAWIWFSWEENNIRRSWGVKTEEKPITPDLDRYR